MTKKPAPAPDIAGGTVTIGVRLPPSLKRKLDKLAAADNRTLSNFIRNILEKEVK